MNERHQRKSHLILLFTMIFLTSVIVSSTLAQRQKDLLKNLSPAHMEWLEIVTPIITDTEREVFFKLKTEQERERFINLFWKVRDPNPDTSENEFYREYMERVHFADRYFGIGSSKRGCLTERGYYYLLLGKPLERQIFATQSDIYPMELWFYKGEEKYGLPGYFYLLFYQPEGVGDYRLYYPGIEGPEKLVIPSLTREQITRKKAIEIIKGINTELAKAAISYLPEDRQDTFSSLSSQTIIAAIKALPEKKFASDYARNYLSYKDLVEVDYSHNFVTCSALARVFLHGDYYFVHWAIEPDKINFAETQGIYSAIYELTIRLEDLSGNQIFGKTEEIPLRLNRQQFESRARQRFAFQDLFPVLPGDYKLLFLLKNKTAKDFTSWETILSVPVPKSEQRLGPVVVFHTTSPLASGRLKAFSFAGQEFLVSARNEFSPTDKPSVFCQLWNPEGLTERARVELSLKNFDSGAEILVQKKKLPEALSEERLVRFDPIDLSQVKPGYYSLEINLIDKEMTLDSRKENLIVLAQPVLTAPWVYGKVHRSMPSLEFLRMLAAQHFLKGNYQETRKILEEILSGREELESRLLLARTFLALDDYERSLTEALKVYESTGNREAAKVLALDYAKLKDWDKARIYVDKLLAEVTEISVLNLAAEIYLNLGNKDQAIYYLEKSLSLVPDQPQIKGWLEDLKKKK